MRIKVTDNGNNAIKSKNNHVSDNNVKQTDDIHSTNKNTIQKSDFIIDSRDIIENRHSVEGNQVNNPALINTSRYVCNKQYMINLNKDNTTISDNTSNDQEILLEQNSPDFVPNSISFHVNNLGIDISADEIQVYNQSSTYEMSTTNVTNLPRGIVNPNYPGFQHLAHTLQDYNTTNIGSCEHSENEISDDEIDLNFEKQILLDESKNRKGINLNFKTNAVKIGDIQLEEMSKLDSKNQIPDLLKTLTENNNNNDILVSCTTTDIENNFNTRDIIGDFNKEVEDEIRQLLNYNINIEDDLQELRKDIQDTFAKPIENTINNISEVVNDVIKKLVEIDSGDKNEMSVNKIDLSINIGDDTVMKKENETNARTELNISRPTFLLIENNINNKITDAILSDGKEEINVHEYNTEQLSYNVENTIKQLSTELRKIIPKLNEMREREKIFNGTSKDIPSVTDRNSNNILQHPIKLNEDNSWRRPQNNLSALALPKKTVKIRNETRSRQSSVKSMMKLKTNVAVRKEDREYEESFDVYNIETALPKLDFDAIESHIKAAKEAERRVSGYTFLYKDE